MKERPILFSAPMVRALLDGSKTQTRRIFKLPRGHTWDEQLGGEKEGQITADRWPGDWHASEFCCPYGQPGDRLWVRENFKPIYPQDPAYNGGQPIEYDYAATYKHGDRLGDLLGSKPKWKPSIHMPRAACRITLEATSVRVEQLQDISPNDCIAEGAWRVENQELGRGHEAVAAYRELWESINGPGSWAANPWLWVIEFKRIPGEPA